MEHLGRLETFLFRTGFTLLMLASLALLALIASRAYDRFFAASYVLPKSDWVCTQSHKIDLQAGPIRVRNGDSVCVAYQRR